MLLEYVKEIIIQEDKIMGKVRLGSQLQNEDE